MNNLSEEKVTNADMGYDLIGKCEMNRNIGSTSMNPYSSRSHAIYMFKILHKTKGTVSNLYFIDLAGSERLKVILTPDLTQRNPKSKLTNIMRPFLLTRV